MGGLVSVIIPTFNEEKDISACILSLKNQTYSPLEIIVVDDGSTDNTRKVIKDQKIKLLSQLHRGPGPARNFGAKHAKGEILVFVDSDMTFDSEFVKYLTLPIKDKKTIGTFTTEEFVSNWNNSWSRCWNYNNGNRTNKRISESQHDHEDFRAILSSEFRNSGGFTPVGYTDSRTLVSKLGSPMPISNAVCYHKNPSNVREVFIQAKWIGKRRMRLGILGQFINLVRHTFPISLVMGVMGVLAYREIKYLIFKITYDFGFTLGIISNIVTKNTSR